MFKSVSNFRAIVVFVVLIIVFLLINDYINAIDSRVNDQDVVTLKATDQVYDLFESSTTYIDHNGEVSQIPSTFGGKYTIQFRVANKSNELEWYLKIGDNLIDKIKLTVNSKQIIHSDLRNSNSKNYVLPNGRILSLELPLDEISIIEVEMESLIYEWSQFFLLESKSNLSESTPLLILLVYTCFGAIFGVLIYSFSLFISVREKVYLWYFISSISLTITYLFYTASDVILFGYQLIDSRIIIKLFEFSGISHFIFSYYFLNLHLSSIKFKKVYNFTLGVSCIVFIASFFITIKLAIILIHLNNIVLLNGILIVSLIKYYKGSTSAIFLVFGWLPGATIHSMWFINLINNYKITGGESHIAEDITYMVIHLVLLSFALTLRVKELKQTKNQIERKSKEQTKYFLEASHDLRQPIQSSILLAQSINDTYPDRQTENLINNLRSFNLHLNELLDFGKIEQGQLTLHLNEFSLNNLIVKVVSKFQTQANNRNIKIKYSNTKIWLYSDELLVERLLHNLLGNAIKFSENGSILIGVRRKNENISLQIFDTGDGMDDDTLQSLFTNLESPKLGSGLGLLICKQITNLLGTNIEVESKLNTGTSFKVLLPLSKKQESNTKLKIIIYGENNEISNLLAQWGYNVETKKIIESIEDIDTNADLIIISSEIILEKLRTFSVVLDKENMVYINIKNIDDLPILQLNTLANHAKIRSLLLHFGINQ